MVVVAVLATAVSFWMPVSSPGQKTSPEEVATDPTVAFHRAMLRQFAFRTAGSSTTERQLREAQRHFQAGRAGLALVALQEVLDANEDCFLLIDNGSRAVSARGTATQILDTASRNVLKSYEASFGGQARALLRRAYDKSDPELFKEIGRRFFHTAAGFEATSWVASWHTDHGQYESASRNWEKLLSARVHRRRVTRHHRLKAILAYHKTGRTRESKTLADRLAGTRIVVGGKTVRVEDWLAHVRTDSRQSAQPDWNMAFGGPARNPSHDGSVPLLQPNWTTKLVDEGTSKADRRLHDKFQEWQATRKARGLPAVIPQHPLVVAGNVVVRTFDGLQAFDLASGESRWNFVADSSLRTLMSSVQSPDLERVLAANPALGMLSSDGSRVFAVDSIELRWSSGRFRTRFSNDQTVIKRRTNRLVALDANNPGEQKPVWSVGGPLSSTKPQNPLSGHFFLGPPLPMEGKLYAVTEFTGSGSRRQLNLVALEAESGKLLWMQGIALVDIGIEQNFDRYLLACTPSFADGVLVCPTQQGFLVGVDLTTRSLLWMYDYAEPKMPSFNRQKPFQLSKHGDVGFIGLPLVHDQRVVFLPHQSSHVHCLDLATGKRIWRIPRADAEYVAAASDKVVLIVGRRHCRGISLTDGTEKWFSSPGACAGRGVPISDSYVLPLENGGVANLSIRTGARRGFSQSAKPRMVGNLAVHDDVIVSLTAGRLDVFPQAATLLPRAIAKLSTPGATAEDNLRVGELELVLGKPADAKAHLSAALNGALPPEQIDHAERMTRQALLLLLHEQDSLEQQEGLLAELEQLSGTPEITGQILMLRAELELEQGRIPQAIHSARRLAKLSLKRPIALPGNAAFLVSQSSWIPDFFRRAAAVAESAQREELDRQIDRDLQSAILAEEVVGLRDLVSLYPTRPQVNTLRQKLAVSLIDEGQFQAAEFLLLENRVSDDRQVSGRATLHLARLWSDRGALSEAARLYQELTGRFADVASASGKTLREVAQHDRKMNLARQAAHMLQTDGRPVSRVTITSHSPKEDRPKSSGSYIAVPTTGSFGMRTIGARQGETRLIQRDRLTDSTIGTIALPRGYQRPDNWEWAFVRHFFALGSRNGGAIHGFSLIDGDTIIDPGGRGVERLRTALWTTVPPGMAGVGPVKAGPAGPTFCTFQSAQQLVVLDPANGRIRWQRRDIAPGGGLFLKQRPLTGLFGDEDVLVLFGRDQQSYTVYDTATGTELRRGRLDVDPAFRRYTFGRNLLHATIAGGKRRLRLWDARDDQFVFDRPLNFPIGRFARRDLVVPVNFCDDVAIASPSDNRLQIINGHSGAVQLDVQLDPRELKSTNYITVLRDKQRYYVNIQRGSQRRLRGVMRQAGDVQLHKVRMTGDLLAFDRTTNKQWKREINQRSILYLPGLKLPFWVAISKVKQHLEVEVIDRETGRTLGFSNTIYAERIVHASYDSANDRLELHGERSVVIDLQLHRGRQGSFDGQFESAELSRHPR